MRNIFFLIFICIPGFLFGTDSLKAVRTFRHFTEEDGLFAKTVYTVLQDKEGFIWLSTDDGAFRYDGKNFKRYTVNEGMSDNDILQLYEDRFGRIWFLTFNGYLSFWQDGVIHNPSNTPYLKKAYIGACVYSAIEDKQGALWFSGQKMGLIVLRDTNVQTIIYPEEVRDSIMTQLHEDHNGGLWYFKGEEMISIDEKRKIKTIGSVWYSYYNTLSKDFYYNGGEGICRIRDLNVTTVIEKKNMPDYLKIVNISDMDGDVWICTKDEGCIRYRNGKEISRFLDGSFVMTAIKDKEGNYWFSTMNDGVYLYYNNEKKVKNYDKSSGLSENKVLSLMTDSKKSIWVGYDNGCIDKISGNKVSSFNIKNKIDPNFLRIMGFLEIDDTVWCGSDVGLLYSIGGKFQKVPYVDPKYIDITHSVKQILTDDSKNIYATYSLNFIKLEKDSKGYFYRFVIPGIKRTFSAVSNGKDGLYVSGVSGLMEYSPGKPLSDYKTDYDFSHLRIIDMKIDSDKKLILATNREGIFILDGKKMIQHVSTNELLSDNNCKKLLLKDSVLYVATGNGLNVLKKVNERWEVYKIITMRDGLLSNSINDMALMDGQLYIGTDKGLSKINLNSETSEIYYSKVVITEIVADSVYSTSAGNFSFRSDVSRLLIRFSYPAYDIVNKARLKYRLLKDDSNEEWISSENNEVEFLSLSPGAYKFEIIPDLKESKVESSILKFDILPMWYQTLTAKVSLVLLVMTGLGFSVRRRVRLKFEEKLAELKRKNMIDDERNRIANDMHDDIGADLTQISIWSNILKGNEYTGNVTVEKISNLSKDVLLKMDQIIWALDSIHNRSGDLFSYLHSYASEYLESADIDLNYFIEENIPDIPMSMYQRRNIFLAIKELLHNTVKHSKANEVGIKIFIQDINLYIEYTDNGGGFVTNKNVDGLGLITMKKRMKEINSEINIMNSEKSGMKAILKIEVNLEY